MTSAREAADREERDPSVTIRRRHRLHRGDEVREGGVELGHIPRAVPVQQAASSPSRYG